MTQTLPIVTARDAMQSLRGKFCPGCRRHNKQSGQTFCRKCYFTLPSDQRRALYNLVGEGYEAAVSQALASLGQQQLVVTDEAVGA